MFAKDYQHIPVLLKESIAFLNVKPKGTYVDCNLGSGGHAEKIKAKVIGIDMDQEAINSAKARLKNIACVHDNFRNIKKIVKEPVDGILFDLGLSSYQIDEASRGFSLQNDGPLDMRMDKTQKLTAAHIINNLKQEEMEKIFKEFGEERFSHRIAKAIINKRPFYSTFELKEIVEKAIPTWKKRESVTRIFQSLRIAVNQELASLEIALKDAITLLKPGGRLVVLSYHSLEDRIVKHTLRQAKQAGRLNILTKKPIMASEEEIASNPRARSAKLRAAEFK
ncbi:16S rRNA (cytosine(1402)-N(4))-methyltransferase [candidate division WOR-1 bacterium RIFCSPLOWO2_02_FULL_46_20]|uniref:Ribosomal RNA small subunit methyltransferase H n=2 Tax=Saganbacteria TaxID=1703751 RepID=A0A1F4R8K2_UNCSA|nr:MAG: 16S rRNA (cytosine(1402)-N(4))-methyltransferase [candidate division WOR-1 bacterium RIFCSPHIGHO2_02_FULL_45_12]OGC04456.1 MAG: 16S rRNA (cytosine(1402)-N(4))-methyltransferase [candidate division WOR-1 bacterium RIFCSPLOWO2_02_FULL_46_20]OGC09608.1 MAG: 16S rRNA (cytosine(1402)-N(4))-methyltransferase [candidate division WOR-1 bacterium RIFCSPLOWO2_12_FULL_45_9]